MKKAILLILISFVLPLGKTNAFSFFGKFYKHQDIVFNSEQGIQSNHGKLDVYYQEPQGKRPVIIFVHGGGWVAGDKGMLEKHVPEFIEYFLNKNYILVNANYRLFKRSEPKYGRYDKQASDVAKAVKWTQKNAHLYGGDGNNITLIGFSAGAHLVALTGTDLSYLKNEKINPKTIKNIISIDVHNYDVSYAAKLMQGFRPYWRRLPNFYLLFGKDKKEQQKASPSFFVKSKNHPNFLIISSIQNHNLPTDIANKAGAAFESKLRSHGVEATHRHFNKSHTGLIKGFKNQEDGVREAIEIFLK